MKIESREAMGDANNRDLGACSIRYCRTRKTGVFLA
jgi:hypothetical protein